MQITIVAQNLNHGGLTPTDDGYKDRWPLILDRIRSASRLPDVVLLCETMGWEFERHSRLARAMRDLDMEAMPLPRGRSRDGTALLYRHKTMGRWLAWDDEYSSEMYHGFGVAAWDVGLPAPLSIASVHIDPFRKYMPVDEASMISTRALRNGPYAILAGDVNFPPPRGPEPLYKNMQPYNIASRTVLTDPSLGLAREPYRDVAWMLEATAFHDVAWEWYDRTGDDLALARTASDDRVDQGWVTTPLLKSITGYRVLDAPSGASDHLGFEFTLDLSLV
ncbi:MAG TPA: hypothetical protein VM677_27835 [Actinokineospora sp.]|jgi:endonuclease/exonuclease/phosphatase family metal-dependent hydrolase|nr:hypothetical protein [Actinokineospora sp.]